MFRFFLNLMRLSLCELTIRTIVRLITPNTNARRKHWILSRKHPSIIRLPPTRMNHNFISYFHIRDFLTNGPNNARGIGTTGMKILRLSFFLTILDNVNRKTKRRPNVIIVYTRCHHINQYVLRPNCWRIDDFSLPCFTWLSKPVLSN